MQNQERFLHEKYDSIHDSKAQRKFRKLCPMPFGVVFLPWKGMTEEEMREHFRLMKSLGFHNLKQTMGTPDWPRTKVLKVALEEGVIPFWYGEGGWEDITDELLEKLGIPRNTPMEEIRKDPRMLDYQNKALEKRIYYEKIDVDNQEGTVLQDAGLEEWGGKGLRLYNDPVLREDAMPLFKKWVKQEYKTIEALQDAWNQGEVGITPRPYASWEEFDADEDLSRHSKREYRFIHDILRFKADMFLMRLRKVFRLTHERDPEEPQRAGGEMGLFLPFAWRGTDMEGIAEEMREYGSFYPSIHLAWHYEEVSYEVARCIYMQASLSNDWFKGGWSSTWESTGGPQQFSGGKGWNIRSAEETAGFTVNPGTMTQLLLSYLAAGYKGVGLWCWNYRRAGWEAGEYALLNRQNEVSPRAIRAGKIAQAANRYREELWGAHKEPQVGIMQSWDNEAIWAAVSVPNRDHFKHYPVYARVGASRSLINSNIPWEHVTASDLRNGLAPRYGCIFLPAQLSIPESLLEILAKYVSEGGRVVLDAPGGWFDEKGAVLKVGKGSVFEELFGVQVRDFQYSNNVPRAIRGHRLDGFIMELEPTKASVVELFQTGEPAITENRLGKGTAKVMAFDASRSCFKPGNTALETILKETLLDKWTAPYSCQGAIVYRLAASGADHYFFINDGPATTVRLNTPGYQYKEVSDPVADQDLVLNAPIELEAYSGRWLRFEDA